ncbi:MAG: hypothetical protein ACLTZT_09650 [Butyricimonas faecalis]
MNTGHLSLWLVLPLPLKRKNTTTYYEKILEQMYYLDQNFKQKDVKQGFISLWANEYVQNNGIKQIDELNKFTRKTYRQ